jgi:hypothetical protein
MKRPQSHILLFISIFVLSVGWTGCSLLGLDGSDARIVLGENIEGVDFGDSKEEVIQKLGEPDYTQPADLAGERFSYNTDGNIALEFTVSTDPAIGLGVIGMQAYPAYDGKTADGIGTGSSRSEVIEVLGQPDETHRRWVTYVVKNSRVTLEYRDEEVHIISMNAK